MNSIKNNMPLLGGMVHVIEAWNRPTIVLLVMEAFGTTALRPEFVLSAALDSVSLLSYAIFLEFLLYIAMSLLHHRFVRFIGSTSVLVVELLLISLSYGVLCLGFSPLILLFSSVLRGLGSQFYLAFVSNNALSIDDNLSSFLSAHSALVGSLLFAVVCVTSADYYVVFIVSALFCLLFAVKCLFQELSFPKLEEASILQIATFIATNKRGSGLLLLDGLSPDLLRCLFIVPFAILYGWSDRKAIAGSIALFAIVRWLFRLIGSRIALNVSWKWNWRYLLSTAIFVRGLCFVAAAQTKATWAVISLLAIESGLTAMNKDALNTKVEECISFDVRPEMSVPILMRCCHAIGSGLGVLLFSYLFRISAENEFPEAFLVAQAGILFFYAFTTAFVLGSMPAKNVLDFYPMEITGKGKNLNARPPSPSLSTVIEEDELIRSRRSSIGALSDYSVDVSIGRPFGNTLVDWDLALGKAESYRSDDEAFATRDAPPSNQLRKPSLSALSGRDSYSLNRQNSALLTRRASGSITDVVSKDSMREENASIHRILKRWASDASSAERRSPTGMNSFVVQPTGRSTTPPMLSGRSRLNRYGTSDSYQGDEAYPSSHSPSAPQRPEQRMSGLRQWASSDESQTMFEMQPHSHQPGGARAFIEELSRGFSDHNGPSHNSRRSHSDVIMEGNEELDDAAAGVSDEEA